MTKNPLINAAVAALYIVAVASLMFYGPKLAGGDGKDTLIVPVAMISLFTLSAAMMSYLFLYNPLQMLLEGNKKQGLNLFLKTVLAFAVITVIAFTILFLKA